MTTELDRDPVVLDEPTWRARAAAHRDRVGRWTDPHRERRRRGEPHPVLDFLFTYYSLRPARLEQWLPGPGVVLLGAEELLDVPGHVRHGAGVRLDPDALPERISRTARFVHDLLVATAARPPRLGCFGLHEWAMVYRSDAPRHGQVPLRLGSAGTDAVVDSLPVHCTHHDAFRFFTDAARPLNALQPARSEQIAHEQPGCLHATMDLYKWAYKLSPATPAGLLADCFELAVDVRELDMRASPYDLADLGYAPVQIETPAGRAEYARAQAGFARRAAPLRSRLVALCRLLESADG
ncbi:3-methyladenine DNA glycosylase [Pseudonocardia sp. MH-G8]|uniref:3-methyladenine DNA glycosylase n=1 Tax=Pseudonocardia sp. MH-G8 TaxID=1854588 RepID=UPI000BA144E5|nr:3-methyladenine DNA glycosylase [Pseudonocardia sp. MH-G8]OZM78586.1 3-methyladenine DNA glycosylase [Pseudonocardia sp. MH-G8]